jgi:hypothetical protein
MPARAVEWKIGYMPLIIGGIGTMASALFMPWLTVAAPPVGEITRLGIQTRDGRLFALGLLVLAVLAWSEARTPNPGTRTALLVGFVVLGATVFIEYQDLTRLVGDLNADFSEARLGFGIYGMGLGLTVGVAGVLKRRISLEPVRHASETKVG